MPYKAILDKKTKTAYIEDEEGIRYVQFLPHPDGDPWMDKIGIEIILNILKISITKGEEWIETENSSEIEIDLGK